MLEWMHVMENELNSTVDQMAELTLLWIQKQMFKQKPTIFHAYKWIMLQLWQ